MQVIPIRRTSRSKLREVDFKFGDTAFRGVEQNPSTNSRWAKLAREGKKVMQFLVDRRYVAGSSTEKLLCTMPRAGGDVAWNVRRQQAGCRRIEDHSSLAAP